MIKETLKKLVERKNLTDEEAKEVMNEIMSGQVSDTLIASFLTALRMKGETVDEIYGFAQVMREKVTKVNCKSGIIVDTCGTGGDGKCTFNVSTAVAFVVAGAGFTVAKHGNRSVSSKCGSADLLETSGVKIDCSVEIMERCLNEIGIAFLFAPLLHPAMKYVMPARKELGIRTVFNILGPLTNPAGANVQLLGVYDQRLVEPLVEVLAKLGVKSAYVVYGNGLDEITLTGETNVAQVINKEVTTSVLQPEDFGFQRVPLEMFSGGSPEENAKIFLDILRGEKSHYREIVLLNAGATIYLASLVQSRKRVPSPKSIKEAIPIAKYSIDSGKALEKLNQLRKLTNVARNQ
jgi:anthranilate phosphoribosyltransferase